MKCKRGLERDVMWSFFDKGMRFEDKCQGQMSEEEKQQIKLMIYALHAF